MAKRQLPGGEDPFRSIVALVVAGVDVDADADATDSSDETTRQIPSSSSPKTCFQVPPSSCLVEVLMDRWMGDVWRRFGRTW